MIDDQNTKDDSVLYGIIGIVLMIIGGFSLGALTGSFVAIPITLCLAFGVGIYTNRDRL